MSMRGEFPPFQPSAYLRDRSGPFHSQNGDHGASGANLLNEIVRLNVARATRFFSSGSSTMISFQGWELLAEGASRTDSISNRSFSGSTGVLS